MAFRHGVYKSEVPTSLLSPVQGEAGLPVVVGTAPIFMADSSNVNVPVLCYSYSEAVQAMGFVHRDWDKWTLCEFIYSQFALYGQSPVVLINVFDPATHKEAVSPQSYTLTSGEANLGADVIISTLIASSISDRTSDDCIIYTKNTDYSIEYDDDGKAIFSAIDGGRLVNAVNVFVSFDRARPDMVTASDIVGGINAQSGQVKGLELVNKVFPKFRLIPGIIAAPKWSENSTVAAVMAAKADSINGLFTAISVVDIPSDSSGAKKYNAVPEWKNNHNFMSSRQIACWPKVKLGDDVFHLSTQLIGLMNQTDSNHDDIPYKSPSNELLQIDGCVNASGDEINLGLDEAVYLNSQGILTALNFIGGWKAWGDWTAIYPASTDPKDSQIVARRMFDFIGNTFITTFWQQVDEPLTPRFIKTIINSFNVYLNGMTAREQLLGGRIEFLEDENPTTDIMAGIVKFHVYMTPAPAAAVIEGIFEYDTSYFSTLINAIS